MLGIYLRECTEKRKQLQESVDEQNNKIKEYEQVMKKLDEIIKKLEIPVNSPVCEVAFFCDGRIKHTNEVMIDLGCDYFAECSSYTAKKVIRRRISAYQKSIQDGLESIKMIDDKLTYANSLFDKNDKEVVEITEPFDEEAEKEFYEKRKNRKSKEKSKQETEDEEYKKAMARLADLEAQEAENKEIEEEPKEVVNLTKIESDAESDDYDYEKTDIDRLLQLPGVNEKDMKRLLEVLDACDVDSSEEDEDDDGDDDDLDSDDYDDKEVELKIKEVKKDEVEHKEPPMVEPKVQEVLPPATNKAKTSKPKKGGVKFSKDLEKVKIFEKSDTINVSESQENLSTKSILKTKQPTPVDRSRLEPEQKKVVSIGSSTFPGMVIEKNETNLEKNEQSNEPPKEKKKVSLFKQSKSKK
ncbi:unnamed protein product [Caenorhabditis bovis]|uniref:Uncharacterized protein n=1 Tax=Caenorhabditis bovis TaxID=2654633 RepID=A0A8S1F3N6_9PELO|nr:unnamed protein product [Caenorhabditis bovis]